MSRQQYLNFDKENFSETSDEYNQADKFGSFYEKYKIEFPYVVFLKSIPYIFHCKLTLKALAKMHLTWNPLIMSSAANNCQTLLTDSTIETNSLHPSETAPIVSGCTWLVK